MHVYVFELLILCQLRCHFQQILSCIIFGIFCIHSVKLSISLGDNMIIWCIILLNFKKKHFLFNKWKNYMYLFSIKPSCEKKDWSPVIWLNYFGVMKFCGQFAVNLVSVLCSSSVEVMCVFSAEGQLLIKSTKLL